MFPCKTGFDSRDMFVDDSFGATNGKVALQEWASILIFATWRKTLIFSFLDTVRKKCI
jgi:hypothetical protein